MVDNHRLKQEAKLLSETQGIKYTQALRQAEDNYHIDAMIKHISHTVKLNTPRSDCRLTAVIGDTQRCSKIFHAVSSSGRIPPIKVDIMDGAIADGMHVNGYSYITSNEESIDTDRGPRPIKVDSMKQLDMVTLNILKYLSFAGVFLIDCPELSNDIVCWDRLYYMMEIGYDIFINLDMPSIPKNTTPENAKTQVIEWIQKRFDEEGINERSRRLFGLTYILQSNSLTTMVL